MNLTAEQHREILVVFREEVREIGERMTSDLLALEAADTREKPALFTRVLRDLHTLKGNARSLDLDYVAQVAHAAEGVLRRCERGELIFDSGMTSALLSFLDHTGAWLQALIQGEDNAPSEVMAELRQRFERWGELVADPAKPAGEPRAPPSRAEPSARTFTPRGDAYLRVSLAQLEGLSRAVDELVVARLRAGQRSIEAARAASGLAERARRARARGPGGESVADEHDWEDLARNLAVDFQTLGALTEDLQEALKTLQLVPAAQLLEPFRRAVRDQALAKNKQVRLQLSGGEVVADRRVLEALRTPLNHLIANAVDHGIEPAQRRQELGKDPVATLRILVTADGPRLRLTLADDGAGVDLAQIREVARARGIWSTEEAAAKSDEEALALLWHSGFSTAASVTDTSGRGIGLDAVRDAVLRLSGHVELSSEAGRGTVVRLEVPLTMAQSLGLLVEAGGNHYLLPLAAVEAVRRFRVGDLRLLGGALTLQHGEKHLPAVALEAVLTGIPQELAEPDTRPLFCILRGEGAAAALMVDRIHGEREMAVRALGPELAAYEQFAGVSLSGDGRLVLVLDGGWLLRRALQLGRGVPARPSGQKTLLVVDDAVSSRLLYRGVLEAAGYRVLLSGNGEEALEQLSREVVDGVICDVRMPRMDGLELTRRFRAQPGKEEVPLLLVSALSSEQDRLEGLRAGASAFLVKGETTPQRIVDLLGGLLS
jgi:two-component system chemotaxis sensor kinase CheA